MTKANVDAKTVPRKKTDPKPMLWLVYLSVLLAGVMILGDVFRLMELHRWTVQLAVAMIFSAFALLFPKSKTAGVISAIIIWSGALISIFN